VLVRIAALAALAVTLTAGTDPVDVLPLDAHSAPAPDNVVSRLAARVRSGEVKLTYNPDFGYLPAVLDQLKIPFSSQVLVFSKTSFQAPRIAPRTPRALYHNDEVYAGWVRGGDVVELAAFDPGAGIVFYTLDQEESRRPVIEQRGTECLQCHHHPSTLGVPGLVVRSIVPDRTGMPVSPGPSYITDHRSPIDKRWGGWFVSGKHGGMRHMGNAHVDKGEAASALDTEAGANLDSLDRLFTSTSYLSPHSDIVSLMVLEHRIRVTNLANRLRAEHRLNRVRRETVDALVAALRMDDEAPLTSPVEGPVFRAEYPVALNLKTRLFEAKRSPLIESPIIQTLPDSLRKQVLTRVRK
jgi:hypothetical protein